MKINLEDHQPFFAKTAKNSPEANFFRITVKFISLTQIRLPRKFTEVQPSKTSLKLTFGGLQ